MIVGLLASTLLAAGISGSLPAARPSPSLHTATTFGDLVVTSGETYTIGTSSPGGLYFQEGNITVDAGGTLIVQNSTLSFVQFVTDGTTLAQQFSHLYRFVDAGTVRFVNSVLTTDVNVLNFSAKLFLSVSGTLTARNSSFEFPGWLEVTGSGAVATFNDSVIEGNPGVQAIQNVTPLTENATVLRDTLFAPTINVTDGGQVNLFGSDYRSTYADNLTHNGVPASQPVSATGLTLPAGGTTFPGSDFALPSSNPVALSFDTLYPSQASGLELSITYTTATSGSSTVSIVYDGTSYTVGTATFTAPSGTVNLPLAASSTLLTAMTLTGIPLYANPTVTFGATGGPTVTITDLSIAMVPAVAYNLTAWGTGSQFNTVDSSIDLNWAPSYMNQSTGSPVFPWDSNKLQLYSGADAFLGNLTVPNALPANFSTSAVQTFGTSQAYLYRWAQFAVSGRNGTHLEGAIATAFYAYTGQASNATANAANDFAVSNPAIWAYLQYWDTVNGAPSYGASNLGGHAWLLLASAIVNGSNLPSGTYLGDYNVGISVPAIGVAPLFFAASVRAYPSGVAYGTPGYDQPDVAPSSVFTDYFGAAKLGAPVIYANGTIAAAATVREGQLLGVSVTLIDEGTAKVFAVAAALAYNTSATAKPLATYSNSALDLTAPGQTYTFNLTWVINDTVTGLNGTFTHRFPVRVAWNDGLAPYGGGNLSTNASVTIAPSQIRIVSLVPPTSPLSLTESYVTTGVLQYNGSQAALIEITATPVGGGTPVTIALGTGHPGAFAVSWYSLSGLLTPGTTYTITATATYNSASATYPFPGTYSVPSTTTPTSFLYQKFLGLPFWLWLVIAAAIVVAIVAVLLIFRRQAAGKLVECGECGELIPEDATVCPKCGAQFETELVRCSRCSSTIPANSQFCPECGAQLLGKPGEGAADPERQAYADFTERFRAEAKKDLGDNYTESAFWDWWKRQPTYVSFSQWKAQQASGAPRAGMAQPPAGRQAVTTAPPPGRTPPRGGGAAPPMAAAPATTAQPPPGPAPVPAAAAGSLKACPNCGKEIPAEYLVCPFCGAVTQ